MRAQYQKHTNNLSLVFEKTNEFWALNILYITNRKPMKTYSYAALQNANVSGPTQLCKFIEHFPIYNLE